jgi:drug/metabolite transporter (DMT)-like permease
VARAFALAPASIISPFHYVQLVWAAVLGYLVFGDVPAAETWLGAALIIGSGLFIALGATHRAGRAAPRESPGRATISAPPPR